MGLGLLATKLLAWAIFGVAGLAAMVAHELTHYVAALAVGAGPRIDWGAREVAWHAGADEPTPSDRAIALAPQVVGVVAGIAVIAAGRLTPVTMVALIIYVAMGGRKDWLVGLHGEAVTAASERAAGGTADATD